jgi:hypothetical protein
MEEPEFARRLISTDLLNPKERPELAACDWDRDKFVTAGSHLKRLAD